MPDIAKILTENASQFRVPDEYMKYALLSRSPNTDSPHYGTWSVYAFLGHWRAFLTIDGYLEQSPGCDILDRHCFATPEAAMEAIIAWAANPQYIYVSCADCRRESKGFCSQWDEEAGKLCHEFEWRSAEVPCRDR